MSDNPKPLAPLPRSPSKDQEIAHLRAFVEALPPGYLRDIFHGSTDYIANLILTDLALPAVAILQEESVKLDAENKAKRGELQEVSRDLAGMRRELDRVSGALQELRRDARKLAGV